jgi:hypothetical protein
MERKRPLVAHKDSHRLKTGIKLKHSFVDFCKACECLMVRERFAFQAFIITMNLALYGWHDMPFVDFKKYMIPPFPPKRRRPFGIEGKYPHFMEAIGVPKWSRNGCFGLSGAKKRPGTFI